MQLHFERSFAWIKTFETPWVSFLKKWNSRGSGLSKLILRGGSVLKTKSFRRSCKERILFRRRNDPPGGSLCEQVLDSVTSFGELLYQRRSPRRPNRKYISIPPNASVSLKETKKPRREAPRRNVMESKHTEAAPDRRVAGYAPKLELSRSLKNTTVVNICF